MNAGRFQQYIVDFIKTHRDQMQHIPSAFFSVSLTEADPDPTKRARAMHTIARLQDETSWQPDTIASFAGSIAYLRYRWLMRLIWRRLALPGPRKTGRSGGPTDKDYEYTDWDAVAHFANSFVTLVRAASLAAVPV